MDRHTKALEILKQGTIIPATPLALTANRKLDERRQRALMRYYLDCGVGGIATAVHTTQFEIRKPEHNLFEPILKLVSEEISAYEAKTGKVIVRVAGVCGPTEQAVAEARLAKSYGYDAVLLSPGGLQEKAEAYLIDRTKAVAAEMPVIGFHLQEACGGRALTYDYSSQVAGTDNVVAIKAAPFNRYQTLDVARAVACSPRRAEVTLYTGNDDNILLDLLTKYTFKTPDGNDTTVEFKGGLLGHWSVWTKSAVALYHRAMAAKHDAALDPELLTLAQQITDANAAFFDPSHRFHGCIAGIHEVLRRQGLLEGIWCLNEQETLSPGQAEEIQRVYDAYPQLNDDAFVKANLDHWLAE